MGIITGIIVTAVIYWIIKSRFADSESSQTESELTSWAEFPGTEAYRYRSHYQNKRRGTPAKWHEPGQPIQVQGHTIDGGMIYVGESLPDIGGYENDACLINPKLKAIPAEPGEAGDELGYWPRYGHLSAKCRGAYLAWLASGRSQPQAGIGYVFLFFYGLERRLFIDGPAGHVSEKERTDIVREVRRLLTIYGTNRSFRGYANHLLAMEWAFYRSDHPIPDYIHFADRCSSEPFQIVLAQIVAAEKPIPAEIARQWLTLHPEFTLRTPARRCAKEFSELFRLRFSIQFPKGFFVKANKTPLKLEYRAASSSFRGTLKLKAPDLPNPFILTAPLRKLEKLAEECTLALEPYSRFLGRKDNTPGSLAALTLLPEELMGAYPAVQKIRTHLAQCCANGPALISVKEFYHLSGEKAPSQIGKKEAGNLADLIESAGYGIAPHIHFHHLKPTAEGNVVIFPDRHPVDFHPSKEFRTIGAILRLGAIVSQVDGDLSSSESATLQALVINNPHLAQHEKKSLLAFLKWCLHTPQSTAGIKQMLTDLHPAEKTAIGHILISVAYADGCIDRKEIRQLEKLYNSLGLDKEQVTSDLHTLASAHEPMTVSFRDPENSFAITRSAQTTDKANGFSLDEELIRIREEETRQVRGVLENIFADPFEEPDPTDANKLITQELTPFDKLDTPHQRLLTRLLEQETWEKSAFHALCKELDLMMDGAMEVLNEWAFENANAPLIDDGDPVYIDVNLAKEITNAGSLQT